MENIESLLKEILADLALIKHKLDMKSEEINFFDDIVTAKEACKLLKISRTKYENMKREGLIKDFGMNGGGRKRYVKKSEISELLKKPKVK